MPGPRIPRLPTASPDSTATSSYRFGYLIFIPLPFVSTIAAGAAIVALYPRYRRAGGIAAENGRRAANWGLTVLAAMLIVTPFVGTAAKVASEQRSAWLVWVLVSAYLLVSAAHIAVVMFGRAFARQGRVFENPLAIPFIRPRTFTEATLDQRARHLSFNGPRTIVR